MIIRLFLALFLILPLTAPAAAQVDQLSPETREGLAIRQRHNLAIPTSTMVVYIYSNAVHHVASRQSVIAWRDAQGRWTVSRVFEEGPGLLDIPVALKADTSQVLTPVQGRLIDRLLRDRDIGVQVGPQRENGVGAPWHTMEIVTPRHHRVISWTGRLRGPAGDIADLVIGHS